VLVLVIGNRGGGCGSAVIEGKAGLADYAFGSNPPDALQWIEALRWCSLEAFAAVSYLSRETTEAASITS